jgi:hypothetical protein
LANANAVRDWRIYADFAQHLIGIARRLYADDALALELDETVYALDSTTIDLCLSVFPWAPFRRIYQLVFSLRDAGSWDMVFFDLERVGRPEKIGPRIVVCALGCSLTRPNRLQVLEINAGHVVFYLRVGASNRC